MTKRIIATITADDNADAQIVWKKSFTSDDPMYRADVLEDVRRHVSKAYFKSVDDMQAAFRAVRLEAKRPK